MQKRLIQLLTIFSIVLMIVGCSNNNELTNNNTNNTNNVENVENEEGQIEVLISITKEEGEEEISTKEVKVEEGAILMDVLEDNFEIEEENGLITSIDGVEADDSEQIAWMYFVNGDFASVGANEYELQAGDDVNFDLQSWE
ncbi:MAG TPA: DUF4430 domain-containing protein [Pseudogracilibacillus sp.]|nr:DUF4430 domain-containing protein [Pseudogracilibacillus sp.]